MDLKGVFTAEPKSLHDTIGEAGLCFYLPAYQRPYSWNKKNITRVFEDVLHGLGNSIRNEDAITFIGTILTIHDTRYQTITPINRTDVPAKVMLVIDGQQRLTTMLMIVATLHEYLSIRISKIEGKRKKSKRVLDRDPEDESVKHEVESLDWLLDKLHQEIANLRHFSTNTNSNRDARFCWYPKIIRAYKDQWGKTPQSANYESPAASIFHKYNLHVLEQTEEKFKKFDYVIEGDSADSEKHDVVLKNRKEIAKSLNKISKNEDSDGDQPSLKDLMGGKFKEQFQFEIPDILLEKFSDTKYILESLNLLVFSKYFLNRVCVTYVSVNDEAYAFDMFEALNTTGEPLTSIETFKPKVIEFEGLDQYEQSKSKQYMDIIDGYLDEFTDATKKHKETTRLMLSFSLAETGEKISTHISDQRRYLLDEYKLLEDTEKRLFIKNLSDISLFYRGEWEADLPSICNDTDDEFNLLRLLLSLLKESKHEITIPLISRYYSCCIDKSDSNALKKHKKELKKALKAIVAFYVLWRAGHRTTAGIDSVYRKVLKSGVDSATLPAVCRKSRALPSAQQLAAGLRSELETKILENRSGSMKDRWIAQAVGQPHYDISKPLTRILMLSGFHDSVASEKSTGLIEKGAEGSLQMLSYHKWKHFLNLNAEENNQKFTIEHIAPQKQDANNPWHESLDDEDLIHSVGNLTILPKSVNTSVSNASWEDKKKKYVFLCEDNKRKRTEIIESGESTAQGEIMEEAAYLGFLKPLSEVEEWNSDFIKKRSDNILNSVWDRLYPWLNP